jgi:hypothetical protein
VGGGFLAGVGSGVRLGVDGATLMGGNQVRGMEEGIVGEAGGSDPVVMGAAAFELPAAWRRRS